MGISKALRRLRYAKLLVSARNEIIAGRYDKASSNVAQIFDIYGSNSGAEAPVLADVMRALVAWNFGQYDTVVRSVRTADDKIDSKVRRSRSDQDRNELLYLKCYCWTLLHFTEKKGASVPWSEFKDLDPSLCAYVDPSTISRAIGQTFPIDPRMFTAPNI